MNDQAGPHRHPLYAHTNVFWSHPSLVFNIERHLFVRMRNVRTNIGRTTHLLRSPRRKRPPRRGFTPFFQPKYARQRQTTYLVQRERPLLKRPGLRSGWWNDFEHVAVGNLDRATPIPGEHLHTVAAPLVDITHAQGIERRSPGGISSIEPL